MDPQDVAAVEVLGHGVGIDGTPWRVQRVHGRADVLRVVVGEGRGVTMALRRSDIVELATVLASAALDLP